MQTDAGTLPSGSPGRRGHSHRDRSVRRIAHRGHHPLSHLVLHHDQEAFDPPVRSRRSAGRAAWPGCTAVGHQPPRAAALLQPGAPPYPASWHHPPPPGPRPVRLPTAGPGEGGDRAPRPPLGPRSRPAPASASRVRHPIPTRRRKARARPSGRYDGRCWDRPRNSGRTPDWAWSPGFLEERRNPSALRGVTSDG